MKNIEQNEQGQSTVELALLIPMLALFLMLILQVAVVVRQHVLVANAARTAARESSVNKNQSDAISLAHRSAPKSKVSISRPSTPGQYLKVKVTDKVESTLPIIGVVFPDITVSGESIMRVEK